MDALKRNKNVFCSVSPFQVNRALFLSKTLEQPLMVGTLWGIIKWDLKNRDMKQTTENKKPHLMEDDKSQKFSFGHMELRHFKFISHAWRVDHFTKPCDAWIWWKFALEWQKINLISCWKLSTYPLPPQWSFYSFILSPLTLFEVGLLRANDHRWNKMRSLWTRPLSQ